MAAKKSSKKKPARQTSRKPAKKAARKPARAARRSASKTRKVPPAPKGMSTITPSLTFEDAAFAMVFYEKAFGAKELYRLVEPSGKIGHAEIRIGDSIISVSDEYPDMAILSAKTRGGSPVRLNVVVKNADAAMERAVAAGATVVRPTQNEFYGYRSGVVMDPFGYTWIIMSQIEVLSPKEMQKRWTRMLAAAKPEGSAA
jgi:PhnB protein